MMIFVRCICKWNLCFPFNMPDITNPNLTTLSYKYRVLLYFAVYFINTDVTGLNRFSSMWLSVTASSPSPIWPVKCFQIQVFLSWWPRSFICFNMTSHSWRTCTTVFLLKKQNTKWRLTWSNCFNSLPFLCVQNCTGKSPLPVLEERHRGRVFRLWMGRSGRSLRRVHVTVRLYELICGGDDTPQD